MPVGSFTEQAYLQANPDVRAAVQRGDFTSGLQHYNMYGQGEARQGGGFNPAPAPTATPMATPTPAPQPAATAPQNTPYFYDPRETPGFQPTMQETLRLMSFARDPKNERETQQRHYDTQFIRGYQSPAAIAAGSQAHSGIQNSVSNIYNRYYDMYKQRQGQQQQQPASTQPTTSTPPTPAAPTPVQLVPEAAEPTTDPMQSYADMIARSQQDLLSNINQALAPLSRLNQVPYAPSATSVAQQIAQTPTISDRPEALDLPSTLGEFQDLDDLQRRAAIATEAIQGEGIGRQGENYYLNLLARSFMGDDNQLMDADLLPIEQQYLQLLGLEYGDPRSFLDSLARYYQLARTA